MGRMGLPGANSIPRKRADIPELHRCFPNKAYLPNRLFYRGFEISKVQGVILNLFIPSYDFGRRKGH